MSFTQAPACIRKHKILIVIAALSFDGHDAVGNMPAWAPEA